VSDTEVHVLAEARDNDPLLVRAMSAYYRQGRREGHTDEQITIPANSSFLAELGGKRYVVLENVNGVLAVYRVRNDGVLKGLKRWPRELEAER
jgi:hypothetical protein